MQTERREKPRSIINGLQVLSARRSLELSVVPLNLSEAGMCARWSQAIPLDEPFSFILDLARPVRLTARVVWHRPLPDHQIMAAVTFVDLSQRATAALRSWQKNARRAEPRRADFLPVEIIPDHATESFTAVASDLSRNGLQIHNDFKLSDHGHVTVLLPLETSEVLELRATVRWQKAAPLDGTLIGLQFTNPPAAAVKALDEYVEA